MRFPFAGGRCQGMWVSLFLWTICLSAQAQDKITLLKKQLAVAKTDTSRSRLLYELGVDYEEVNHDSSVYFLTQSLPLAQRSHDRQATAKAMYRLGYMQLYYLRDEAKALEWLNKGIAVAQKSHDTLNLARCYQYIAVIAYQQHIGNAEEIAQRALGYAKKANDWKVLTDMYEIMSLILGKGDPSRAELYNLRAMNACEKHDLLIWFGLAMDYCDILDDQGKHSQAQAFYRKLIAIKPRLTIKSGDYSSMMTVALFETRLKNYSKAERLYLSILAHEKTKILPDTFRIYHTNLSLLDLYASKHDYQKAYFLGQEQALLRVWRAEKSLTRDSQIKMTQLKASMDMDKKEAEIVQLDQQQKQQRIYLAGAIIVAILLLGFLLVLQRNRQKIERQRVELGQLNTTKDKLFAILSHDLRSPVASLKNYLMLINWGTLSNEEFAESAQDLTAQLNNVHTMLENVLSWSVSQMGGMKLSLQPVPLAGFIEEHLQVLKPVVESKQIHITNQISPGAHLIADRGHLAIIIRNLLQNALKYTHPGGSIWINHTEEEGFSRLTVRDTGIGMEPELLHNLFQLKSRGSRIGTNHEQGTGLGLVLVHELVVANGGQIAVVSEPGNGTAFTLSFRTKDLS